MSVRRDTRGVWQRPTLRTDEEFDRHRPVGWLELFFDLVFVVVIARLAHHLAGHVDVTGLVVFALQFVAVFWVWSAFTYYTERFESDGLENRLFAFLGIVPVAGLAVFGEEGLGESFVGFALSYLLARAVNIGTWIRAGFHVPAFRPVAIRFVIGFSVVVAVMLASLTASGDTRLALWSVAVALDIATPYFTIGQQALLPRLSTSKFPERFGLFTIIVLGESVVGVIAGLSDLNDTGALDGLGMVQGVVGLAIGFGMWWIYFDFIARRPPRPTFATNLGWVYLHLVAVTSITVIGVGVSVVIADAAAGPVSDASRHLLTGGVVVGLVAIAALETTLARRDDEPTHPRLSPALKIASAAAVGVLASIDLGWSALALLGVLLAGLIVSAAYGAWVWYTQPLE